MYVRMLLYVCLEGIVSASHYEEILTYCSFGIGSSAPVNCVMYRLHGGCICFRMPCVVKGLLC